MTMYARVTVPISISATTRGQTPFWLDQSADYRVLPVWVAQTEGFARLWAQGKVQVSTSSGFGTLITAIPPSELAGSGASSWTELADRPETLVTGAGQANGYATLDGAAKVPVAQLPSSIMEYQGTFNASTNTPALADGTGNAGDVYRVSVAGTRNFGSGNIQLRVGDYVIYNGSVWEKSATTDTVATVAGLKGDVTDTALKTALALDNVSNTSDANKPVSSATQTALDGKLGVSATAAQATKLATPRTINGLAAFDGTANISTNNVGWLPADYGWLAWAYDLHSAVTSAAVTAGTVTLVGIKIPAATTITNIILPVQGNLTTGATGQNFVGLYQSGNLLAASADQTTNWAAPGIKTIPLTSPQSVTAGLVHVAVLCNASTTVTLSKTGSLYIANAGLSSGGFRFATADTSRTTLPATLGTQTASSATASGFWAAVS